MPSHDEVRRTDRSARGQAALDTTASEATKELRESSDEGYF